MNADFFQPDPVIIGGRAEAAFYPEPPRIFPGADRQPDALFRPLSEARKDNALAEARYCLSARAQKFVLFAITLIDRRDLDLKKCTPSTRPSSRSGRG